MTKPLYYLVKKIHNAESIMLFTFDKKTVKKASAEEGAEHQAI